MQMFPVVAICGHLCGLHMTATTAIPEAVLMGFTLRSGSSVFLYFSGIAAMISVSFGVPFNPFLLENSPLILVKKKKKVSNEKKQMLSNIQNQAMGLIVILGKTTTTGASNSKKN